MKQLKPLIICLFLLGLTQMASAQVPGYIGKRFHIQAGMKFFPAFGSFPVNMVQPDQYYAVAGMNHRFELGMDFVITRKSSVGLNGHFFNTAIGIGYGSFASRYAVDGGAIGAVFKTYFGSWVAPLGSYYRVETGVIMCTISNPNSPAFVPYTYPNGYINNAFGRTHIFANKISLDYGFEIGFVFPPYDDYTKVGRTNVRMTLHYLANAYVKIGGLF